ncbi:hypothetical protein BKA70DRAFT_694221 [Coprinopsis sp. MPI-PUGE-AT-0042]|nr:hypothetical protein BKA70DRAFT_694221 [Coprinopsis sp. MPI-PUGE-AT-0042]
MSECNNGSTIGNGLGFTTATTARHPLEPTAQSLATRARIAQLISPLRRVKPRVPFWELAAHRIPTLWGLYRGLLANTSNAQIRWRIRKLFEKNQNLTGTAQTIERLNTGYKWLDTFKRAKAGDLRLQSVLERYGRLIETKRKKEHWKQVLRIELEWQEKLRNKPILTGSLLPGTRDNKPMPRLHPQPAKFGSMFIKRRRIRELRLVRQRRYMEEAQDLVRETEFEEGVRRLASGTSRAPDPRHWSLTRGSSTSHGPPDVGSPSTEPAFSKETRAEWLSPLKLVMDINKRSYALDEARVRTPITPEMVATMARARTFKILNKTHERNITRQGFITNSVVKRKRQAPPSWVLDHMTPEQKHRDRVVRGPSEGGYTGRIKATMGVKMRNPELWKKEEEVTEKGKKREKEIFEVMAKVQKETRKP